MLWSLLRSCQVLKRLQVRECNYCCRRWCLNRREWRMFCRYCRAYVFVCAEKSNLWLVVGVGASVEDSPLNFILFVHKLWCCLPAAMLIWLTCALPVWIGRSQRPSPYIRVMSEFSGFRGTSNIIRPRICDFFVSFFFRFERFFRIFFTSSCRAM